MWRASDQEALSLDSILLLQQQQQGSRAHDSLFHPAQVSQDHVCTRIRASELHSGLTHGLQQVLLPEADQGHTADLSSIQLEVDNVTLATALGLGGEGLLAQFHRNLSDQAGQTSPDLTAALAASLGVPPEGLASASGRHHGLFSSAVVLPQSSSLSSKDHRSVPDSHKSGSTNSQLRSDTAESDNQSKGGEGGFGAKRKGPLTEEEKKRRRQEINRQSARRIRERKSLEMEQLKQQNAALQQSQTLLLTYASTLAREKTVLVQRTVDLTERWNQAAAENIELRERMNSDPTALRSAVPADSTYHHNKGDGSIKGHITPAQWQ